MIAVNSEEIWGETKEDILASDIKIFPHTYMYLNILISSCCYMLIRQISIEQLLNFAFDVPSEKESHISIVGLCSYLKSITVFG